MRSGPTGQCFGRGLKLTDTGLLRLESTIVSTGVEPCEFCCFFFVDKDDEQKDGYEDEDGGANISITKATKETKQQKQQKRSKKQ